MTWQMHCPKVLALQGNFCEDDCSLLSTSDKDFLRLLTDHTLCLISICLYTKKALSGTNNGEDTLFSHSMSSVANVECSYVETVAQIQRSQDMQLALLQ